MLFAGNLPSRSRNARFTLGTPAFVIELRPEEQHHPAEGAGDACGNHEPGALVRTRRDRDERDEEERNAVDPRPREPRQAAPALGLAGELRAGDADAEERAAPLVDEAPERLP